MAATCAISCELAQGLRHGLELGDDLVDGLLDAALEVHRVHAGGEVAQAFVDHACASTVAVVVPSPAISLVRAATSRSSCAPMFSKRSSSSTDRATRHPS
jgi:hypothetical protein